MQLNQPTPPQTTPNWSAGFRRRVPFYILAALLLGIIAAVLTFIYLDRLQAQAIPTTDAVLALQDIRPGEEILVGLVEVRPVPASIIPAGAFSDVNDVIGRIPANPIEASEIILSNDLTGERGSGLSARLPDGRWAMVLPSGWLVSPVPDIILGDRIDLVAYLSGQPVVEAGVIVGAVEVLEFKGSSANPERLTLAVTLEEAIAILYARANGFNLLTLLRPEGA